MLEPLNPQLYGALRRRFPSVEIANQGERAIFNQRLGTRGRLQSIPLTSGEYYRVSCPFCDDTRQRLWINHMFGVRDDDGDDHLYMASCFNEACINSREVQVKLHEMIFPFEYGRRIPLASLPPVRVRERSLVQCGTTPQMPLIIPLNFPLAQKAQEYLASRDFNSQELERIWHVSYCYHDCNVRPPLYERIVVPVFGPVAGPRGEVLLGWQARAVGNGNPRYLTMAGMAKSSLLYGLPKAVSTTGPVVVVEGVTDVWRMGLGCVASLGKSLSTQQINLLLRHFRGRPIVILFDADAPGDAQQAVERIRAARQSWSDPGLVTVGVLPAGRTDVAECTREESWACVRHAIEGA